MKNLIVSVGNCGANIVKDLLRKEMELNCDILQINQEDNEMWESRLQEFSAQIYNAVILTCGLGGKTSELLLEPIANFLIEQHVLSNGGKMVCLCTWPFHFEGEGHVERAQATLESIRKYADIVVVQFNDKLDGDDEMSKMNRPIVEAGVTAFSIIDKPLIYVLDAIMDSDSIDCSFDSHLSGSHIDIYVNENRLKNMVNEALGIDAILQSPYDVNHLMGNLWHQRNCNQSASYNNIFQVQLLPHGDC